jgi:PIN domain nuclease of toxin-antitoxin system
MYVTDTHPFVHHTQHKFSKLGRRSQRLFRDADEAKLLIYIPSIVLWEIVRPPGLLSANERFDAWCRNLDQGFGYIIEPLEWQDVNEARNLPFRDPVDCLIVGTALRLGYPLITKDQAIVDSGLVETIW